MHHLGDKRLQFGQSIAGRQHDDNRDRQFANVLLVLDAPIHRDKGVETLGGGELQQESVSRTGPALFLNRVQSALRFFSDSQVIGNEQALQTAVTLFGKRCKRVIDIPNQLDAGHLRSSD